MNVATEVEYINPLNNQLIQLRKEFNASPFPNADVRKDKLVTLKKSLLSHREALVSALSEDFGYRSEFDSVMADIMPTVTHINYSLKHITQWMKPSKRHAGLVFAPSKIKVQYQPLGVVGIISPWNFPVILSLAPLVTAIAAGNKVMLKLSEFTPKTNRVITDILKVLPHDVEVVEGEADTAQAFSQLPFDHLLFTGSTSVGRFVAKAAADTLTPITLELGGKSPVIVAQDANLVKAVDAILFGKCLNAGQICVSPDYAFVPQDLVDNFVQLFLDRFKLYYAQKKKLNKFTQIINQRQFDRLEQYLVDAKEKGAKIHTVEWDTSQQDRCLLPHLVTEISDDMALMQEEIFGPILPIMPYQNIDDVIGYINRGERPLALYLMSEDKELIQKVTSTTHSGGVAINDTVLHVGAEDAPFGGVGQSGIGHYHGIEGFHTFSHAKTVFHTPSWLPRNHFIMKNKKLALKVFNRFFLK
ncbi:coniferyl aldehyde dehydrogenase [Vibrio rumoiensis]|uniref:Aldehyde dehydrogenase n=1 Tax=Vibrio rumoiensis 1S-45 TaxID=1188252 RepID=A0A1E5E559_9VIBR|nr:coniferyl aldehyde dehydrogenase [Vibrio rumoiensis]OEF28200.1 coniferyl-aldehyde dehydrogenase [Vibrio rumoiensis 1S-45]